ncbi:MAG: tetratricopeptide repeat protein, partial [Bacteroidales bacterium]
LIAIGYAYLDNGYMEEASEKLTEVKKLNKTDPKVYVLEGDILLSSKNLGSAAGKYDMAIYFDSTHTLAYIKGAKIYENSNWQTAIEKLKKLITLQPDYIIAYRYMGKIYTSNGYYPLAIEAFKKYFMMGYYNIEDIVHYATALYFNGQYQEAVQIIKEGLAIEPNHFVLNRLLFYSAANLHDIENGLFYATNFLSLEQKNTNQYLAKDYEMYAKVLKDAKKFDQAILEYQKAISIDSNNPEIYKDMADLMNLKSEYGNAADLYQQYIDKKKQ